MKTQKGFVVEIIKSRYHSSNGGISSVASEVTMLGDGIPQMYEPNEKAPAVKIVRREIGGREYIHAEPINSPSPNAIGWMASGAFLSACDSRFPSDYPIPLHDRQEFTDIGEN